ncbi:hypothetical protein B0H14DRAFT_2614965 [Mycena olivaceomarginata]|nr:hypothetical protein B0H14DRAFT_2614965 [Mycena olivaceomarginata]
MPVPNTAWLTLLAQRRSLLKSLARLWCITPALGDGFLGFKSARRWGEFCRQETETSNGSSAGGLNVNTVEDLNECIFLCWSSWVGRKVLDAKSVRNLGGARVMAGQTVSPARASTR